MKTIQTCSLSVLCMHDYAYMLVCVCQHVCDYPLEEVLASDRLRLTGWLTDWLRS